MPTASAAKFLQTDAPAPHVPTNRVPLTVPGELKKVERRKEVWSRGPVYHHLDPSFLERPLIPRAPPTPRLRIDRVDGSLRVFDAVAAPDESAIPETVTLPKVAPPVVISTPKRSRVGFQVLAVVLGFAAGLLAALICGWL
ncbi:MAG: hypothetical protein QM784_02270 [Polyangiaceae bacterium]